MLTHWRELIQWDIQAAAKERVVAVGLRAMPCFKAAGRANRLSSVQSFIATPKKNRWSPKLNINSNTI